MAFLFIALRSLIFLLLLFGFQKVDVTKGCGESYQHRYNGYENVCSVSDKLMKHGCICLPNKGIFLDVNDERILVKN
jgi:hypothetical protein